MKPEPTLSDLLHRTLSGQRKNIEPVPRLCGGYGPRYVRHRFDIKGGISGMDLLAMNVQQHNALWMRLHADGIEVIDPRTVYRDA